MPEIIIRPAIEQDAHDIVRFIRALAVFEREHVEAVKISEQDVSRDGFGPAPRFDALIAEVDGSAVGFALFFPTYSTWEGSAGIHLEDIYVDEHARSLGVGRRLMVALAEIAVERDCARLELAVLDWNPAREFYHRLGMAHMDEWLPYRMEPEQVRALAAEATNSH
jgi:GNAT superfamily N-acetyltransferase